MHDGALLGGDIKKHAQKTDLLSAKESSSNVLVEQLLKDLGE